MNRFIKIVAIFSLLIVTSCANPHVIKARKWVREFYYGPPKRVVVVPYNVADERWCYNTLGAVECYQKPQRLPPESLIATKPPSLFPQSREDYAAALAASEMTEPVKVPDATAEKEPAPKAKKPQNIKNLMRKTAKPTVKAKK